MATKESRSGARGLWLLLLLLCVFPVVASLGASDFQAEFNRTWGYMGGALTSIVLLAAIIEGLAWILRKLGGGS